MRKAFLLLHLDRLVLEPEPIEGLDGLVGVIGVVIVDESISKTLACNDINLARRPPGLVTPSQRLTCDLVPDELAALHLPDGGEERPDLLLGHGLRQIVDDEVRPGGVVRGLRGARIGTGRDQGGAAATAAATARGPTGPAGPTTASSASLHRERKVCNTRCTNYTYYVYSM